MFGMHDASPVRPYHILLVRDEHGDWSYEFGDYDKDVVKSEYEDYRGDYRAKDLKVLSCPTDTRSGIWNTIDAFIHKSK